MDEEIGKEMGVRRGRKEGQQAEREREEGGICYDRIKQIYALSTARGSLRKTATKGLSSVTHTFERERKDEDLWR